MGKRTVTERLYSYKKMKKRLGRYKSLLQKDCINCEKEQDTTEECCRYCFLTALSNQLSSIGITLRNQIYSMETIINDNFHLPKEDSDE